MKQLLLLFGLLLGSSAIFAQDAALVLFTENGEAFTATLNGAKQNDTPMTRVRCTDLNQEFYQVKIDFEDASLLDFNANIALEPGLETTSIIKMNKKGKYVLRMFGTTPLSNVAVEPVAEYTPLPVQTAPNNDALKNPSPVEEEVTTTTTITTGSPVTRTEIEDINIEMTVPGLDMKVKMEVPGMEVESDVTYTETVTTTTTNRMTRPAEENVAVYEQPNPMPGYSGPIGCDWPADDTEMKSALESIKSKSFEDGKLTVAKQIAKNKCLTAEQVKQVMMSFGFEETKLDFAKFAYDYTYDQGNYYVVNDAFGFEMTIDELNDFLESR